MTRDELVARLTAEAEQAERYGATAPLGATLRTVVADLSQLDGVPAARPAPDRLLTLEEAAARLGMTPRAIRENKLPFLRRPVPGGPWRASEKALDQWLKTR